MDLYGRRQIVDSTDKEKAACSGSRFVSSEDQITEPLLIKISLEQPKVSLTDEYRYIKPLWVSRNEEPQEELHASDSSRSKIVAQKIRAALKLLAFREEHVIIQFWSARDVGEHQLLTTSDQPFGFGSPAEELFIYRKDSVWNVFLVDKNHPEGDISPPARVFRRGSPEWTPDLINYLRKDFPQQECAIRCNLHGYLALPVFESTTGLCVGVLELLTSSKYKSYEFEVQQIHKALKTVNLTSPHVYDSVAPMESNQRMQDELDKILDILRNVCAIHKVPLAQTWAETVFTSFFPHDKMIERSCSSFDTSCLRKVCMSTTFLPYLVQDMNMLLFREACKKRHLDKSRSFVGKAGLCGSNYCDDITLLCEEEYPLVHEAQKYGIRSCFAISLHGEGDTNYVLEFFLPLDGKDSSQVLNLVQTIKQNTSSEFVLGKISHIQITIPPRDASYLSSSLKPQAIGISSKIPNTLPFGMDSCEPETETETESDSESDSESDLGSFVKTDSADVQSQCSSKEIHPNNTSDKINMVASRENNNATSYPVLMGRKMSVTIIHAGETSKPLKQGRKHKIDTLTVEAIEHIEKPKSQAVESLVGRSTLKRFCREDGIHSWPEPNQMKKTSHDIDTKLSQEVSSQQSSQKSSKVTVKATFEGEMIKFQFPTSSGLLELKNEIAQRFNIKGELKIKYKDEEDDVVLITCNNDLHDLPGFFASNTTVKLLVELILNNFPTPISNGVVF